jgi:hypothetical protein
VNELLLIVQKPFSGDMTGYIHSSGFMDQVVEEAFLAAGPETPPVQGEENFWLMLGILEGGKDFFVSFSERLDKERCFLPFMGNSSNFLYEGEYGIEGCARIQDEHRKIQILEPFENPERISAKTYDQIWIESDYLFWIRVDHPTDFFLVHGIFWEVAVSSDSDNFSSQIQGKKNFSDVGSQRDNSLRRSGRIIRETKDIPDDLFLGTDRRDVQHDEQ